MRRGLLVLFVLLLGSPALAEPPMVVSSGISLDRDSALSQLQMDMAFYSPSTAQYLVIQDRSWSDQTLASMIAVDRERRFTLFDGIGGELNRKGVNAFNKAVRAVDDWEQVEPLVLSRDDEPQSYRGTVGGVDVELDEGRVLLFG